MKVWMKRLTLGLLSSMIAMTAACSGSGNGNNESSRQPQGNTPAEQPSGNAVEMINPLAKYDEPVRVSIVRASSTTTVYPEGDDIDNTIWTRAFKDELNIELNPLWTVDQTQFAEKANVMIASGDIPDLLSVGSNHYRQLAEAGLIMDVEELYNTYASPLLKSIIEGDGGVTLESGRIDGKLMGIPFADEPMNQSPMLWVRNDWLRNVGMSAPTTMDELYKVAQAFKNDDPDRDGQDDTFGLGWGTDIRGFANGFHAYSGIWVKGADGTLQYGDIQPEMKSALDMLSKMYAEGLIDQEFSVKGDLKISLEDIVSGKIGMYFAPMFAPLFPLQMSYDFDGAEWQAYPLVSADNEPAKMQRLSGGLGTYYVINSNAKNPEAVIKMLNLVVEKIHGDTADASYVYGPNGETQFALSPIIVWPFRKNQDIHLQIVKALDTGDTSAFKPEGLHNFNQVKQYLDEGVQAQWKMERIFGKQSAWAVIEYATQNDLIVANEFFGVATRTMTDRGANLSTLRSETFAKIIMGNAPLSDFDKYVADWKNLGGDQITAEVNEWYDSRNQQ